MSELFDKDKRTISEHTQNIFKKGELSANSTIRKFRTVQAEGSREVTRQIDFYNLDVIISVGYRVSSHRGTQFRMRLGHPIALPIAIDTEINEKTKTIGFDL